MRTTLKRGIGRSAGANGNGHAVLPPAILSPVKRYPQPRRWLGVELLGLGFLGAVAGALFGVAIAAVLTRAVEDNGIHVSLPLEAAGVAVVFVVLLTLVLALLARREARGGRGPGLWQRLALVAVWLCSAALLVNAGYGGGAYLYYHESVRAVAAHSKDVKIASKHLDLPLPNQPAIALVVGYDKRHGDVDRGRSDTLMLLRADPVTDSISMMSFPRDLVVPLWCGDHQYLPDRINQAYALCGSKGALDTVKKLTGLPINYLLTVNFRGFIQIVDRVGGVWIDIDRRYLNHNVGTAATNYANIDLRPGYQLLKGRDALSYVRYRHT